MSHQAKFKQVIQHLSFSSRDVLALVATLRPILEEHGFTINALIRETEPYEPENVTPVRSFDANNTSVDELADVLGTLIADLQEKDLIH